MKLIIVRHGETEENKKGILQGHLPGKLSELGINQAKKLALRLKDEKISAIYSSDLARASDTAKEIAKFHPRAEIYFVKELRERNHGELTGKLISEVNWNKPRNTEKKDSMFLRARKIVDEAYKNYKNKNVVFVSHGGLINILMSLLLNKSLDEIKAMGHPENASISILEFKEDNNHNLILFNYNEHLKN